MVSKRDYYEVLELGRDASTEDVKKAFRRLALQYHPDRNREPGAADRFKEVSEAYQILSDPERRGSYDRFGHAAVNGEAGRGFDGHEGFGGFGDIFDSFFGGTQGREERRGRDLEVAVEISFEESAFGVEKQIEIERTEACERCQGTRSEPGTAVTTCTTCAGHGQVRRLQRTVFGQFQQIATCSSCSGAGKLIKTLCSTCRGRGVQQRRRKIAVDVPGGIDDGARIRLRGQGESGGPGVATGDLYVHMRVRPHELFRRDGNDVHMLADVNIAEAALGAELEVPTLDGSAKIKVKPSTQSGEQVRLHGKGIQQLGGGRRGDHIVTVRVVTPSGLNPEQRRMLEELSASLEGNGTVNGRTGARGGRFFGRVKDQAEGER